MHWHLHRDGSSGVPLHSVLHANIGCPVAERTMKLDYITLLVTFTARDAVTIWIQDKKSATKLENQLSVILPFSQAHDVMFDIATRTFERERFQRHGFTSLLVETEIFKIGQWFIKSKKFQSVTAINNRELKKAPATSKRVAFPYHFGIFAHPFLWIFILRA